MDIRLFIHNQSQDYYTIHMIHQKHTDDIKCVGYRFIWAKAIRSPESV